MAGHHVKKVVLPDGRELEVVYFDGKPRLRSRSKDTGLHICPNCDSDLVQPIEWQEVKSQWEVALRCPNCWWEGRGTFSADAIRKFDDLLNAGTRKLIEENRQFTRLNTREWANTFILALHCDQIYPEDF